MVSGTVIKIRIVGEGKVFDNKMGKMLRDCAFGKRPNCLQCLRWQFVRGRETNCKI